MGSLVSVLFKLYVFFIPFASLALLSFPSKGFSVQYSHALLMVMVIILAMAVCVRPRIDRFLLSVPNTLYWVLLVYSFFSIFLSYNLPVTGMGLGEQAWVRSIKQFLYVPLVIMSFMMLQVAVKGLSSIKAVMRVYIYSITVICIFGFYQFLAFSYELPYPVLLHNNLSVPQGYAQYYGEVKRVSSLSGEPAMLGFLLAGVIGYMIPFVLRKQKVVLNVQITYFIFIMVIITSILTTSFSTYIALVLLMGMVVVELVLSKRYVFSFNIFVALMTFSLVLLITDNIFSHRLNASISGESYSTYIRSEMALTAIRIFIDHPIFGVGIGNYGFYVNEYSGLNVDKFWEPMGLLFKLLSELGVFGLALFVIPIIMVFKSLRFKFKRGMIGGQDMLVLKGVVYGLLTTLLVSFFTIPSISWLNIWLFLGMLFSIDQRVLAYDSVGYYEANNEA